MDQRTRLPVVGAPRTHGRPVLQVLLELTAEIMEASFQRVGHGVIMGSMPAFLRRFGQENAHYLQHRYLQCEPGGAVSALTPINFVSRATDTRYSLPVAQADHAVKRLEECEFQAAFSDKSDFAKAMMCRLHEAVYDGSVNGLIERPEQEGFDVSLESRILFGDGHCDFHVRAKTARPGPDEECPAFELPTGEELRDAQRSFYAAIMVAFIEYLCQVLPEDEVQGLVAACARSVGLRLRVSGDSVLQRLEKVLARSDREVQVRPTPGTDAGPDGGHAQGGPGGTGPDTDVPDLVVHACPFVRPINGSTRQQPEKTRDAVRRNACSACTSMLQGTAEAMDRQASVQRSTCLTAGDDACRFHVGGLA